ncbi:MAG TPA: DNA gyrase/topoisomerase IV subunit A [Chitinophagaceae bacterium]|nr:DNA gyrase/topoisomerase IV subunit A [Chitinophagaceae bacterium]HMZ46738.1 DNA gyrase/topoisomerase IV subunit A [Chitinophagaceae bacterium]HNF29666.1 DNA gyrase/topoisomerase IV subunit A [Chitinophagaceae bacterium]HNM33627.1 DNA gyrase/topoisomerase IV subunit A [Chitinophagaceae bacterium]
MMSDTNNNESGVQLQFKNWFLDYASYVILERAVPAIEDGLKPVQRRILHAMKEMDDGRFNKVANIIGQAMQYHPHGDASIGDALVNMGQKDLLIETQGNWGDIRTGDDAAAPRYIEARLSKLALEIAFNNKTTNWQLSYDGRKNEPIVLPMKFPLLLAQGAEGIAVGLSTKILPHNFIEIIEASIKYLKGKKFELYPDFQTGGLIDVSNYNEGRRGGKIKVRCIIEEIDKKSLVIKDVPFGVTVAQLCESITKANDSGKIKIKKLTEFTGKNVEIQIDLAAGISSDITIDALYAFTDCEVSISPNACIIENNKPKFVGVQELLKISVDETKMLLQKELQIKLAELEDKWHYTSLEKIFFEEKIYKELEQKYASWELVLQAIENAFQPFIKKLKRKSISREDVLKLTEKPVRRIYKLDIDDLIEQIKAIDAEIVQVNNHLEHLTDFTITYFENLQKKFAKGRERKSEIKLFDTIKVQHITIANTKLYVNREEGFIGTSLKKDELLFECSDLDDIIVFTKRGIMKVVKVGDKVFIGKDIIHAAIFKKNDERTTYNMIYVDAKSGISYAKRFNVTGITRDKEYDLTKGSDKSKVHYFSSNANGEAEMVKIILSPNCTARNKELEFYFEELEIKGRSSQGNIVTKYAVKSIKFKEAGRSTLSGIKLWFDDIYGRLNTEEKGQYLGMFEDDKLLLIYKDGYYEITDTELTQRLDGDKILLIEKFNPQKIITAIYLDNDKQQFNVKRFYIETTTLKSKFLFIKEGDGNYLETITTATEPILQVQTGRGQQVRKAKFKIDKMVEVMGWKAIGAKLMDFSKTVEMEWIQVPKVENNQTELF